MTYHALITYLLYRINIIRTNVYLTDSEEATEEQYQEFADAFEVLTTWIPMRTFASSVQDT